jgi:NAD-dependent SIR2 family protein deacetylase
MKYYRCLTCFSIFTDEDIDEEAEVNNCPSCSKPHSLGTLRLIEIRKEVGKAGLGRSQFQKHDYVLQGKIGKGRYD